MEGRALLEWELEAWHVCLWRVSQLCKKQPGPNGCSIQHMWARLRARLPEGGREGHPKLTLICLWQNVGDTAEVTPLLVETRGHAPSFLYKPGKVQPWEVSRSPIIAHWSYFQIQLYQKVLCWEMPLSILNESETSSLLFLLISPRGNLEGTRDNKPAPQTSSTTPRTCWSSLWVSESARK